MNTMFQKYLVLASFLLASGLSKAQNNPFYYEHIFNELKTINFVFAFYPSSYQNFELREKDTCTTFKSVTINKAATSLNWNDYKLRVLLKDGRQANSLIATAKEGRLACSYSVPVGETHTQFFCFHEKFTGGDISKIWLVMEDDKKFELELYKDDK